MTETGELTVVQVREIFREAGHHVPSRKRAVTIVNALPNMAQATGWSEREVLDTCLENYASGAVNRLVKAYQDIQRRGRQDAPQYAATRRGQRDALRAQRRAQRKGRR